MKKKKRKKRYRHKQRREDGIMITRKKAYDEVLN